LISSALTTLQFKTSARGKTWRSRLSPQQDAQALAIAQQHDIPDIVARVLAARNVTALDAPGYLDPSLRQLMPDPDVLVDMQPMVARLVAAVERAETVAIFGDYDVDGACSAALLAQFLDSAGCKTIIHIPDRIFEGYGPNSAAIEALAGEGAQLLVCVDCGTTSFETFADAKGVGLDVLVIDHHQAPEKLPEVAALVNPNRLDDISGLGHLCAAGVVYMVLVALNRALRRSSSWQGRAAPDLLAALDLVALATIADVVPLIGLNRAFVVKGLAVLKNRERPGLRALMDAARLDGPPTAYHLGFLLGPRINAGGRIGDAVMGVRLLTTADEGLAQRWARELDQLNRERQAIETAALAEAEAQALLQVGLETSIEGVLVVAEEGWHPGIVGLVAARLKEKFALPTFAIAWNGASGTGSGRSITGVDLGRAVRHAVDSGLIVKGGGHAMAAGVTLTREQLPAFKAALSTALSAELAIARQDSNLPIDSLLGGAGLQVELIKRLESVGPFGSGSPEPLFVIPDLHILEVMEFGTGHMRLRARSDDGSALKAVAFRAAGTALGQALLDARHGQSVALAGSLSINHWGGREEVQFRVIDLAHKG